jgi:restriction endonuclease Mrr
VKLPDTGEVAHHLLILLSARRRVASKEAYRALAEKFRLDHVQRSARRRTRYESAWHNRVQTAREHLVKRGWLNPAERGVWSLTAAGKIEAEARANTLTVTDLRDLL